MENGKIIYLTASSEVDSNQQFSLRTEPIMQSGKVLPGPKTTFPKPGGIIWTNSAMLKVVICHMLMASSSQSIYPSGGCLGIDERLVVCLTHSDTFLSNDKRAPPFSRPVKELDFVFGDF